MPLSQTSIAPVVGAAAKNVQFQASAQNLPRKILVIGTYDPLILTIVDEVPELVTSPEDAGAKYGFGFPIHRLVREAFKGSNGVECWVVPQSEAAAAAAAAGDITVTGAATESGTIYLYIAGDRVPVTVASGDDATAIGDAIAAAINADKELPITASAAIGVVTTTAKQKGTYGNQVSTTLNWGFQEVLPAGVTVVITDLTGGTGTPDIADALNGTGTGDDANEKFFTDMCHAYLQDSGTLDAILAYVGAGNDFLGLYSKTVARPYCALTGDVGKGSAALTTLLALGNGRKFDRANGVIAVPGSPNHPSEIAAQATGIKARINNDRAAQSYNGQTLIGVIPGALADRWTKEYDSRDTAAKAGVSATTVEGNGSAVVLQNLATFYHPDSVPIASNGYRSARNISIIQNMLYNEVLTFSQEKWKGISIVEDVVKVANITDREKARDIDAVTEELIALVKSFESKAWVFTAAFTVSKLQEGGYVQIRAGGLGFNMILPVILSGEGGIFDTVTEFDTSIDVLLS
jgi:phage tail sheath gpL-like